MSINAYLVVDGQEMEKRRLHGTGAKPSKCGACFLIANDELSKLSEGSRPDLADWLTESSKRLVDSVIVPRVLRLWVRPGWHNETQAQKHEFHSTKKAPLYPSPFRIVCPCRHGLIVSVMMLCYDPDFDPHIRHVEDREASSSLPLSTGIQRHVRSTTCACRTYHMDRDSVLP